MELLMGIRLLKLTLFILIFTLPVRGLASDTVASTMPNKATHQWIELGVGIDYQGFGIKVTEGRKGWGVNLESFRQNSMFNSYENRGGRLVDPSIEALSISRVFHWPMRKGYFDLNIGLSALNGQWANHCEKRSSFFTSQNVCDIDDVSGLGVPFGLDIGFGKQIGIASNLRLLFSSEDVLLRAGLVIPLGTFSR